MRDRTWQSPDGTGVIFITARPSTLAVLKTAATDLGLTFTAVAQKPTGALYRLNAPRIGLWDQYGGSMPSGWVRFLLEQFEFPFEVVYPQTLDAGNLKAKFDVLLFPDGGIPEVRAAAAAAWRRRSADRCARGVSQRSLGASRSSRRSRS